MPGIHPPETRERARARRAAGASVKSIAAELGLAASTVSLWVRDVELTPEQRERLRLQSGGDREAATRARSAAARRERQRAQEHGRMLARSGDALHLAGCMLYWAEGSRLANSVVFTNADVEMVRFFVRFLRECYELGPEDLTLSVNCHLGNGFSLEEIERWWCERLEMPARSLRTAAVNRASSASKGVRPPLVYGTARLSLHSTWVAQSIYGAIQEYTGMERPAWLQTDRVRRAATARA